MPAQYVIWEGNDGPSLHGPFESFADAQSWAWNEGIGLGLIESENFSGSADWYEQEPNVWIRPVLAP